MGEGGDYRRIKEEEEEEEEDKEEENIKSPALCGEGSGNAAAN